MANRLRLQLVLILIEKVTGPAQRVDKTVSAVSKALRETRDQLRNLQSQRAAVQGFKRQHDVMKDTANQLAVARQNLDALTRAEGSSANSIEQARRGPIPAHAGQPPPSCVGSMWSPRWRG